jgi:hypothetical protein
VLDGQDVVEGDDEQEIRRKVETEIRKHSHDFEWHADLSVSVIHRVQGETTLMQPQTPLIISHPTPPANGSERVLRKRHFGV